MLQFAMLPRIQPRRASSGLSEPIPVPNFSDANPCLLSRFPPLSETRQNKTSRNPFAISRLQPLAELTGVYGASAHASFTQSPLHEGFTQSAPRNGSPRAPFGEGATSIALLQRSFPVNRNRIKKIRTLRAYHPGRPGFSSRISDEDIR